SLGASEDANGWTLPHDRGAVKEKAPDPRRPGARLLEILGEETRRPYHVPERMHVKSASTTHQREPRGQSPLNRRHGLPASPQRPVVWPRLLRSHRHAMQPEPRQRVAAWKACMSSL